MFPRELSAVLEREEAGDSSGADSEEAGFEKDNTAVDSRLDNCCAVPDCSAGSCLVEAVHSDPADRHWVEQACIPETDPQHASSRYYLSAVADRSQEPRAAAHWYLEPRASRKPTALLNHRAI